MNSINEDVVEHVIDSNDSWCQEDLCYLALISSAWVQIVRKRLYAHPALRTYRSCQHLVRTLEENPALMPLVRALDLRPSDEALALHEDLTEPTAESRPGPTRLLKITSLERLTLGGDLATNAERFLRVVGSPHTIKSLHIVSPMLDGDRTQQQGSLAWDGDLPVLFHSLESLSVDGPLMLDVDDTHYVNPDGNAGVFKVDAHNQLASTAPRGCILKELHLDGVQSSEGNGIICALLYEPTAWRHLRKLTFTFQNHGTKENVSLSDILHLSSGSLEDFSFKGKSEGPHWLSPHFSFPQYIRDNPPFLLQLKSLKTHYIFFNDRVVRSIIPNVESLYIKGTSEASVLSWLPGIHSNDFPRLKKLLLCLDKSRMARTDCDSRLHSSIETLACACKGHGIEFIVVES